MKSTSTVRPVYLVSLWGILGCCAIFVRAIWTLTPVALHPIEQGMTTLQWVAWSGWVVFMIYSEGYRGIHLKFAPRVVVRALHLGRRPRLLHVLFAPLFCMGLFHATRKRLIVSWCVIGGITLLVIGVRQLAQPWRGIVDAGVVIGLVLGAVSILYHTARGFCGHEPAISPDLPSGQRNMDD